MRNVPYHKTKINDGFWRNYERLNREVTANNVYNRLKESGRFDAWKCDLKQMIEEPHIYWDSDIAKWIEGVAYLCKTLPSPEFESIIDSMVSQIEKNQKMDGYFNSYYITMEPNIEFSKRENHELYCAGHLIEAAIAYDEATGKDKFLNLMIKYADRIYDVFIEKKCAGFITPGHEEIELALLKLSEYTGIVKYRDLAEFFLEQRGLNPIADKVEEDKILGLKYNQSDKPVRKITEAVGHAVRACYLYTAMAMLSRQNNDSELFCVCKNIFTDISCRKMSITGGIGACMFGEAFNEAYILPNRMNYNETCAAISLMMFAYEMQLQEQNSKYSDVIERILYNSMLSGISLDGEAFFYENALEIDVNDYGHPLLDYENMDVSEHHRYGIQDKRRLHRSKLFTCFCCPPNIVRTIASIAKYIYTVEGSTIYCNQFISSETELEIFGKAAKIKQVTKYPQNGKIDFIYFGEPTVLAVRIPDWCIEYNGETDNGYAMYNVKDGDCITIEFPMNIHYIEANVKVHDCLGKIAVMYGPLVYCMESIDNGDNLGDIELIGNGLVHTEISKEYNTPIIYHEARRRKKTEELYSLKKGEYEHFTAKLIPYYAFANRDICDMIIWTRIKEN